MNFREKKSLLNLPGTCHIVKVIQGLLFVQQWVLCSQELLIANMAFF